MMATTRDDMVNLTVTSTLNSFHTQRRFSREMIVKDLKGKLELLTGAFATSMVLEVFDKEDKPLFKLDDDVRSLSNYGIEDGMRLHVKDSVKLKGEYEDLTQVEKYNMSAEDYSKRTDTVKSFLAKNRLGKYNEEESQRRTEEKKLFEQQEEQLAKSMSVGDRCEVRVLGQPTRRATVMFIGRTDFKPGWWIGVKYDEPLGKNDGSVQGKRYFSCTPKHGGFIKPNDVITGDFPEEGFEELDEI